MTGLVVVLEVDVMEEVEEEVVTLSAKTWAAIFSTSVALPTILCLQVGQYLTSGRSLQGSQTG